MIEELFTNYINEYIENGEVQGNAFLTGEYKKGNKAFEKIEKINHIIENSDDKEIFYLTILDRSDNANTLTCCCMQMLRLQIKPELARKKLEEIMNNKAIHPILVFNAKMLLQEWDKGNIEPIL